MMKHQRKHESDPILGSCSLKTKHSCGYRTCYGKLPDSRSPRTVFHSSRQVKFAASRL